MYIHIYSNPSEPGIYGVSVKCQSKSPRQIQRQATPSITTNRFRKLLNSSPQNFRFSWLPYLALENSRTLRHHIFLRRFAPRTSALTTNLAHNSAVLSFLISVTQESLVPRLPRHCPAGISAHVIQRGNNRQACFGSNEDIRSYAHWLAEGAAKYNVAVNGWVFMTNHIHLLLTPSEELGISRLMQYIGRNYVRNFNHRYSRSGTLFGGRFRSCLVQNDRYAITCLRYIEMNPVRAGLVKDPGDYQWSSYRSHAFGLAMTMKTEHPSYLCLGSTPSLRQKAYRKLCDESLNVELVAKIRHCTNTGLVLGNQDFRHQVEGMRA